MFFVSQKRLLRLVIFSIKKVTQGDEYQNFLLNKKFFIPYLLSNNFPKPHLKFCLLN